MLVGLGTGSTAKHAIDAIGQQVAQGLRIRAVATSLASAEQARGLGIPLLEMADVARVDLTIDGADEIDPRLFAIKGAGGAMLREKIVAAASSRMVVIADGSKRAAEIGGRPVPVEVLPFGRSSVAARIIGLGAEPVLRMAGDAPYRTDNGNLVFDCRFAALDDPEAIDRTLAAIPGVIGHGLFLREVAAAYIAEAGTVVRIERP
jgi:ribose 5-phosphate isomerase A